MVELEPFIPLADALPGLVWIVHPDGRAEYLNRRWREYTGLSLDQAIGSGWQAAIHPEDLTGVLDNWRSFVESRVPGHLEMRLRRYDGQYRWFLFSAAPMTDHSGRVVKWCAIGTDIDERLKAKDAIRATESEAELKQAYAQVTVAQRLSKTGSFTSDLLRDEHIWSEELYRIFEIDPATSVKVQVVRHLVHPDDLPSFDAMIQRGRAGEDVDFEFRIVTTRNILKHLRGAARVIEFISGRPVFMGAVQDVTENRVAEQALKASETELRRAYDSFSDAQRLSKTGSFITDLLADDHNWSEEVFRIFEFEPGTKVSVRRIREMVHPEDLQTFDSVIQRGAGGMNVDFVFRIVTARGALKHIRGLAHVVERVAGRPMFIGALQDVTESKIVEDALRASERNARLIVDSIPGFVGILSPNGDIEAVNRQLLEYYGKTLEELKERTPDVVHPEDIPRILEVVTPSIASGEPFEVEFRGRRFDGVYRWLQNRGSPLRDANGRIIRWYNLLIDIDERKRAEEALRESEQDLRSVIDGIAGLVAVAAANGELETVNRQVLEYFGRPAEELKNWGTIDIVHPEDLPRILEIFKRSIGAGIPFHYETRLKRFDGEYRWFDARFVPIHDASGPVARWYVLLTDIEDRTQAQARLQQIQSDFARMNRVSIMGELAASLSHEITQPIASARINARAAHNFLEMQPPDLDEVRQAVASVVGDVDRAKDIIDRIREHLKKAPPRKERFDLNAAINDVITLARNAITKNGVSAQTRLAEGLSPVHGDRVQLQQVVLNLTLNAVDALGSVEAGSRQLLISTEQDKTCVVVAVRDTGPGIEPRHLERIFEAFYTTKASGTGMGLSICRSIINAHRGRLWAEANEPRGTVFQFTLPNADVRS